MLAESESGSQQGVRGALWAKSDPAHPLWMHLLDSAAVSLALPNPLVGYQWSDEQLALVVGLHDVGKADYCFQCQDNELWEKVKAAGFPATDDARCRHERLSARYIRKKLEAASLPSRTASAIARAVLAHHGYWVESSRDVHATYAKAQDDLCRMLETVLGVSELPNEPPADLSAFGMRLAGHIVLSDWIASNDGFFTDDRLKESESELDYFAKAKEVAQDWVARLGLHRFQRKDQAATIVETPRPLQKLLLEKTIPPGLVIIEAPMGEGKTEAAWILAEKWRAVGCGAGGGMYMALPTMATSDSLHRRYRDDYLAKVAPNGGVRLVHGMAWLRDDLEPEKSPETGEPGDDRSAAAAWFRPTRRAMLAAHGVGTVDQAMLAGMHVRFGFLRLHGLCDRVLVIDEVHAYDAYMSAIIARLLQWCACLKIPVIMLSATLSARQRAAMLEAYGATGGDPGPDASYPLITHALPGQDARTLQAEASTSRTLKVESRPGLLGDAKETATLAADLVKDGGCCCVILNTVKQAQAVFKELVPEEVSGRKQSTTRKKGKPADEPLTKDHVLLFHARFTAADRQRITERVLELFGKDTAKRPERFILVATQVVEQSLDVDFDHMISEIAPIDLLLQRSGRLHRHRVRDDDPVLHVLVPEGTKERKARSGRMVNGPPFGASEFIYQRYPLLTTLALLSPSEEMSRIEVELPGRFRPLIQDTYADTLPDDASEDLKEAKAEWDDLQEDLAAQAGEFLLCEPMVDEFDPVGADEVGDESDDGNGWRARTRLGLEDVLVIPLKSAHVEKYKTGDIHPRLVKWLYKRSVKIPPYFWPPREAKGYGKPLPGEKKLRGVWLLPVEPCNGGWEWQGLRKDGKGKDAPYTIRYHSTLGLTHGGKS